MKKYKFKTKEDLIIIFKDIVKNDFKEVRTITIDNLYKSSNNSQLRAYWLLIDICKQYMNSQGNLFTSDQVDYYFKMKSGHYKEINGVNVPRSIAFKSDTTKEEMTNLIEVILDFGIENNIDDCYIESYDMKSLIDNYK